MEEWVVPIAHIPKPSAKQKPRSGSQIVRQISAFLFRIATLGLFALFFLFKLLLAMSNIVLELYYMLAKQLFKTGLKKRVVIVGGGYAGLFAAMQLERLFDVTLIDLKEYFEFTPSRLRVLVEPTHAPRVQLPHRAILKHTKVITQPVHYVTEGGVETDRQWVPYDYLLITTGSRHHETSFPPITNATVDSDCNAHILSARVENIEKYNSVLRKSHKILVIGGGTVGVELAGEIVDKYDDKEVILIHSQSHLMPRSPERAARYTEEYLKANHVRLVLGERIVQQSGLFFKTDLGTIIEADLAFVCTGNVPNSDLLKHQFPTLINKYGYVKVNEHMQLLGFPNIFVAGDLTDVPNQEEKLCQTAYHEATVAVANVKNMEARRALSKYVPTSCPMLISLGKYDGVLTYKSWTFTGFIPAVMKEFVEWKEMVFYWDWSHFNLSQYLRSHGGLSIEPAWTSSGHSHII